MKSVFPKNRTGARKAQGRMTGTCLGAEPAPPAPLPIPAPTVCLPGGQTVGSVLPGSAHLVRVGYHEGHEGIHGHHPRRDGGPKTLPEEWPERHVFPLLNVSSYRRRGAGLTRAAGTSLHAPRPRPRSTDGALAPTRLPRSKRPQHSMPRTEVPWVMVPGYSKGRMAKGRHRGLELTLQL